jgi:hypothetical protein
MNTNWMNTNGSNASRKPGPRTTKALASLATYQGFLNGGVIRKVSGALDDWFQGVRALRAMIHHLVHEGVQDQGPTQTLSPKDTAHEP